MSQNHNPLFYYLEREQIVFDQSEFEFQSQSHPDHPSLLSIADTLSFFKINNGVIRVELSEIELLPEHFIALLKEENSQSQLYFIEKKGDVYYCSKDKKPVLLSKQQLESRWDNMVLLVEKSENENVAKANKSKWFWALPLLCVLFFVAVLLQFQDNIQTKIFFLFPIIGILFSVAALKDLFGAKSELLNSFCNLTGASSCSAVVGSSKWKIFEIVNFSDLSIVFFCSQFFGLIAFLFSDNTTAYFGIQQLLLLCAMPVMGASVYYQKFVEKKWCHICLVIISVILLELGYILFLQLPLFEFSIQPLVVLGFVFVAVAMVWTTLKKLLTHHKELKEFQMKSYRFQRNYVNFKNVLISKDKTELVATPIVLGNPDSNTQITIITSPFCGHCKGAHKLLDAILEKNNQDLQINILRSAFNFISLKSCKM